MSSFVCFGEVLWDLFPEGERVGGAPLNVGLRLASFGNQVTMISAVGEDELGDRLLDFVDSGGVSTSGIQKIKEEQTGVVRVTLDDHGIPEYEIQDPSAWDRITVNESNLSLARNANVFIYGSLASRNATTASSLIKLLKEARYKVFDLNLRPPFYSWELIETLISEADLVKFNDEELQEVIERTGGGGSMEDQMRFIASHFKVPTVCVTRGGNGALLLKDRLLYENDGYPVNVADTVGAGDSFLATLLDGMHSGLNSQHALNRACAVGSLVASKPGANPPLEEEEIESLFRSRLD